MNKELSTEKTMTVKEVAEILGVTPEAIKKHVRSLYPGKMRGGYETFLDEYQVTEIKKRMAPTTKVVGNKTSIERKKVVLEAMQILSEEITHLKSENEILKPKAEIADKSIRDEETQFSIRDAGKLLGLSQKEIFTLLREKGLLLSNRKPSQKAINYGILLSKTNICGDGKNRQQAVMNMKCIEEFNRRYLSNPLILREI